MLLTEEDIISVMQDDWEYNKVLFTASGLCRYHILTKPADQRKECLELKNEERNFNQRENDDSSILSDM